MIFTTRARAVLFYQNIWFEDQRWFFVVKWTSLFFDQVCINQISQSTFKTRMFFQKKIQSTFKPCMFFQKKKNQSTFKTRMFFLFWAHSWHSRMGWGKGWGGDGGDTIRIHDPTSFFYVISHVAIKYAPLADGVTSTNTILACGS